MSWLFKDPVVIMKEIISWLFKDPVNSGLAQFDHAQSNSKKWPKGEKDQIAPNQFCYRKKTNKIFIYLSAPFILQNFYEKILELIQSYEGVHHFWDQTAHLSWIKFFGTNHCYYFHLPIGPFHWEKLKKILTTDPQL